MCKPTTITTKKAKSVVLIVSRISVSTKQTTNPSKTDFVLVDNNNDDSTVSLTDESCASEEEDDEEVDKEMVQILEDSKRLKALAVAFLHPEIPMKQTSMTVSRCYFDRPSSPVAKNIMEEVVHQKVDDDNEDNESTQEDEELSVLLQDLKKLKELAMQYAHPELPVHCTDPTLFGRNYFDRPSAIPMESRDDSEERMSILADAAEFRQLAEDYMHPEKPVRKPSDPTAFGRNYFDRPSAVPMEDQEAAEERHRILEMAAECKRLAIDYMHPERPMDRKTTDPTLFGRNYFDRPSAIPMESRDDSEERMSILADATELRQLAEDYMHPEKPVRKPSDPTAFGRNYFDRPSVIHRIESASSESVHSILLHCKALH